MTGLVAVVLAVVVSGCSPGSGAVKVVVEPSPGSVLLLETQGCGERRVGTATRVNVGGQERVLTNRHLVVGLEHGVVDGVDLDWTQTRVSPDWDVAELDATAAPVGESSLLTLAKDAPTSGALVSLVGYRDGLQLTTVRAEVQVVTDGQPYGYDGEIMLLSEPTVPGFSGGPVLDRNGDVVGLLMAVDQTTDLTVAVPLSTLQRHDMYSNMDKQTSICLDE